MIARTTNPFVKGEEICINDGRPSGELLLTTGQVQERNQSNYLLYDVSLVSGDRMYTTKREVVSTMNMKVRTRLPSASGPTPARAGSGRHSDCSDSLHLTA